jgi:multisubunit Na+/H+ antiporter MnhC subunit
MHLIAYLHSALTARLAELRRDGERGDSPVPTAVIIFGLVAVAMAVTALALTKANDWMNAIPNHTQP